MGAFGGGVVLRQPLCCYSGSGAETHASKSPFSAAAVVSRDAGRRRFPRDLRVSKKVPYVGGRLPGGGCSRTPMGFSDDGHIRYYCRSSVARCGTEVGKKIKEKKQKGSSDKKKLKLLKGLTKDLSAFSAMGFGLDPANNGIVDPVKAKMISESAEVLLGQLQQLRAEEKESKRRRKQDQAELDMGPKSVDDCEVSSSSSSSSESSDGECGEVFGLRRLGREAKANFAARQPSLPFIECLPVVEEVSLEGKSSLTNSKLEGLEDSNSLHNVLEKGPCCSSISSSAAAAAAALSTGDCSVATTKMNNRRILEVCMGNKCRKSGAALLLAEFERRAGDVEGAAAVVGCKCMGKCRDGPNVRVADLDPSSSPSKPLASLCIGVDLADVGAIMANAFGDDHRNANLHPLPQVVS